MKKKWRLTLLVFALLVALFALYYQRVNSVRVVTVPFTSQITGKSLPYNVILPRGYYSITRWYLHYPVLYLLHGHHGNHSSWITETDLLKYAAAYQMIIVTPEGENGWYTDSATVTADKFETYVVRELLPDVETRFRVIPNRGGRSIGGYSMGGYGALKFALKYSELFCFAASLSGAFDAPARTDDASILRTFGPPGTQARAANSLTALAQAVSRQTSLPYIYLACGRDDPWLGVNRDLDSVCTELNIVHDYREVDGGHDWACWNREVRPVLQLAAEKMTTARA